MSKSSKSEYSKEEVEASINEHLGKIREFTFSTLGENVPPQQIMTYMMASVSHVAELMWASQVEMKKGLDLTTELFKSAYTQFKESAEEESNEEAK